MSDQHTPDGEATDEPTLSQEEDAAVAALLAALPAVAVPDDVAARIQSALAEETPLSGPVPAWASGGGSVSVLPSPHEREQRQRRSARSARILSAAAGVALVLGTVAVGSQFLGDGSSDSGGSVATGAAERDVADDAGSDGALLQNSGATFSAAALTSQVESLADAAEQPGADLVDVQAAEGASGGAPLSPEPNATAYDATDIAVSPTALGICLGKLAEGGSDTPVAVDAGTWESTPPGESSVRRVAAAVVVLRGEDPRTLDAYVVGALCADPTVLDAQVLFYRAVPRD